MGSMVSGIEADGDSGCGRTFSIHWDHVVPRSSLESTQVSQIIETLDGRAVRGASFAPDDESKLMIVNDSGLVEYDLVTDQITVLDASIQADEAIFSPNAEYVALIQGAQISFGDIFVIPTQPDAPIP